MSRHVTTRAASFAAVLALAAGCTSTPKPAPAPPVEQPISRTRALALAKAGTLAGADMPGWKAERDAPDAPEERAAMRAYWGCMGRPERSYSAQEGTTFTKGDVQVTSGVDVAPTVRQADDDLADARNPAHVSCAEQQFRELLALPQGVTLDTFQTRYFPVRVAGAQAFGYTISTAIRGGRSVRITIVEMGAVVGHAEVGISVTAFGGSPPPTGTLTALLTKAVDRVKKVPAA